MRLIKPKSLQFDSEGPEAFAGSPYGEYRICLGDRKDQWYSSSPGKFSVVNKSRKAAIAACQADFDERWLSGLEIEPLRWHGCDADNETDQMADGVVRYRIKRIGGRWRISVRGCRVEDAPPLVKWVSSEEDAKALIEAHYRTTITGRP